MPVFQGVRKTQNTLLNFCFFFKPPIKIAFLGEGRGKMMLKMGCICCMVKTGSLLKLMPTYPSELERTQSCLFTWAKLGFPLQPPSLMAHCSHPSQYFSRLWNYILVVDGLQLQILSERGEIVCPCTESGQAFGPWGQQDVADLMMWEFLGSDLNKLGAAASSLLGHFLGAARPSARCLITLTLPGQRVPRGSLGRPSQPSVVFQLLLPRHRTCEWTTLDPAGYAIPACWILSRDLCWLHVEHTAWLNPAWISEPQHCEI